MTIIWIGQIKPRNDAGLDRRDALGEGVKDLFALPRTEPGLIREATGENA
jgi:hypothetical protein